MSLFKGRGVTAKTIMLCIMSERHGGEKPGCLPYGERAEAPREIFTAGRQREALERRATTGCSITVVRIPWEDVAWVQFPAPRKKRIPRGGKIGANEVSDARNRRCLERGSGDSCGSSTVAVQRPSKPCTGVRFPSPAQHPHP